MSLPGRIIYQLYHRPLGAARNCLRHGGPFVMRATERGRSEMEAAAATLPVLSLPAAPEGYTLHLMTGRRFWYQTAFCIHSFAKQSGIAVHIDIYDDGTLTAVHRGFLQRMGLPVVFHDASTLRARLDKYLPDDRYPVLRERWLNYPNIRKLIDVHLGSSGWKLVIDSDLIFFRRPSLLLDWLSNPDRPLHAVDCSESYGYSRALMEKITGAPIPPLANVGLCGLRSDSLDWDKLESWCAQLHEREKTNYYLEQALVAMLVAGKSCVIAPAADYITLPAPHEIITPKAVMHHYVDTAKRGYFQRAWRNTLNHL
ncbi:MAG TPA: hypothetical protein VL357_06200 [Rariglobus sp.]|nr:hypothetical protein [Rariglobus sp.]